MGNTSLHFPAGATVMTIRWKHYQRLLRLPIPLAIVLVRNRMCISLFDLNMYMAVAQKITWFAGTAHSLHPSKEDGGNGACWNV